MDNIWLSVQSIISTNISKASYETWLKDTSAEIIDNTVFIKAPNSFARDWIERHYKSLISDCLLEVTGDTYEITVVDDKNRPTEFEMDSSNELENSNTYDELINLIREQSNLLRNQQERIDSLEKRVNDLELKTNL